MKYVFFGTPEFAAIVLDELIAAGFLPDAIICNPDRPAGRKKVITPPPVKKLIAERGLESQTKILQPEKPTPELFKEFDDIDFFVVAAYAKIIPQSILDIPRLGAIGVHPSLLPKYRGSSPIQSAILAGEMETGVTLYMLDHKMDHGPMLAAERVMAKDIGYLELQQRLARTGGKLLAKNLFDFAGGKIKPEVQDESQATLTKKFKTEDGFVENKDLEAALAGNLEFARSIYQKILALTPEPGVWTLWNEKRTKLLKANLDGERLRLETVQIEGKNPAPFHML